ncbi:MAG: biotin/lipoyl-binding protein [Micropruina sp.]|uniref:efflux RND transporter periplasmic adaptor subunit n=1 Tax=Micropruina sp. TaxID=2737536 RepID=UPI0039E46956
MTTETPTASTKRRRLRLSGRKWLWLSVAVVVLIAGGVGAYLLMRPGRTNQAQAITRTVQATLGTQTRTVTVDGTLSPRKQSDVNFAVSGTITRVYVKAGDKVTKNQKLARVDDTELVNAVDLARANLTTAQANYTEVVDNDGSSAAIASANAQVRSARASLTSAQQNLNAAVLRSPIAGTVAAVTAEEGDSVSGSSASTSSSNRSTTGNSSSSTSSSNSGSAGTAQFSVISTASWKLAGSVGSADLGSLKPGQAVQVTPSGASEAIKGTVASVGIVATSTSDGSATFPVVVNLSGTHTGLFSGTTASGVVTIGSYPDVLTVPTAAIRTENGKAVVTKLDGTTASTVEVTVGRVFGAETEITKGLAAGDSVQITFVRPTGTSTTGTQGQGGPGGGFGGGFGGGGLGGGGGQPPGGGTGRQGR